MGEDNKNLAPWENEELESWGNVKKTEKQEPQSTKQPLPSGNIHGVNSSFQGMVGDKENTAKSYFLKFIAICLAIICFTSVYSAFLKSEFQNSRAKFEYRIEFINDYSFENSINRFGREGWEVVFARRASGENDKYGYEIIFKRQVKGKEATE